MIKNRKIDAKEVKNFITYTYDLEKQNLPKLIEKTFKIYNAKLLSHITDYLILGTNKGVVILKFDQLLRPDVVAFDKINELTESSTTFLTITNGTALTERKFARPKGEIKLPIEGKDSVLVNNVFDSKTSAVRLLQRYKIGFSYDNGYMSVVDLLYSNYSILQIIMEGSGKMTFTAIKYGNCSEIEWCPYDHLFAAINTSSTVRREVDPKKNKTAALDFSVNVYRIAGANVQSVFNIDG